MDATSALLGAINTGNLSLFQWSLWQTDQSFASHLVDNAFSAISHILKDGRGQHCHYDMLQFLLRIADGRDYVNRQRPVPIIHMYVRDLMPMEAIKMLLAAGVSLESRDAKLRTPLFSFFDTPHRNVDIGLLCGHLNALLALRARVDAVDVDERTVLHHICADYKYPDDRPVFPIVSLWPRGVYTIDAFGYSPLALACMPPSSSMGNDGPPAAPTMSLDLMHHILSVLHAYLQGKPPPQPMPLTMSASPASIPLEVTLNLVSCLLRHGDKVPPIERATSAWNRTPLYLAVTGFHRSARLLKCLLQHMSPKEKALNPDIVEHACWWGNFELAHLLNEAGFGPNLNTEQGKAMLANLMQRMKADCARVAPPISIIPVNMNTESVIVTDQASSIMDGKRKFPAPLQSSPPPYHHQAVLQQQQHKRPRAEGVPSPPSESATFFVGTSISPSSSSSSLGGGGAVHPGAAAIVQLTKLQQDYAQQNRLLEEKDEQLRKTLEALEAAKVEVKTKENMLGLNVVALGNERKRVKVMEEKVKSVEERLKDVASPQERAVINRLMHGEEGVNASRLKEFLDRLPTHADLGVAVKKRVAELVVDLKEVKQLSAEVERSHQQKLQKVLKEVEGLKGRLLEGQKQAETDISKQVQADAMFAKPQREVEGTKAWMNCLQAAAAAAQKSQQQQQQVKHDAGNAATGGEGDKSTFQLSLVCLADVLREELCKGGGRGDLSPVDFAMKVKSLSDELTTIKHQTKYKENTLKKTLEVCGIEETGFSQAKLDQLAEKMRQAGELKAKLERAEAAAAEAKEATTKAKGATKGALRQFKVEITEKTLRQHEEEIGEWKAKQEEAEKEIEKLRVKKLDLDHTLLQLDADTPAKLIECSKWDRKRRKEEENKNEKLRSELKELQQQRDVELKERDKDRESLLVRLHKQEQDRKALQQDIKKHREQEKEMSEWFKLLMKQCGANDLSTFMAIINGFLKNKKAEGKKGQQQQEAQVEATVIDKKAGLTKVERVPKSPGEEEEVEVDEKDGVFSRVLNGGQHGELIEKVEKLAEERARLATKVDDLTTEYNMLQSAYQYRLDEVNGCKDYLLSLEGKVPGLFIKTLGGCDDEEIVKALNGRPNKAKKPSAKYIDETAVYVDSLLRDTSWEPFEKKGGNIIATKENDPRLKKLRSSYGQCMADLVLEKRRELEMYNPSGHYPVKKLWKDGELMKLPDIIKSIMYEMNLDEPDTKEIEAR